ncbi:proteasome regulatory particle base subunit [Tulasnella sp. 427]|nr:proteasome regulatory particle base subunit [Tulasnella sp. 427]
MLQYARETQHVKIIRGLAIGEAFTSYGHQEEADKMVEQLLANKDSILRYAGVYTLALAYAGTADNAVKNLLHVAVSDTSDDVRRATVTCLAFLFENTGQVPRPVQLLSESYNQPAVEKKTDAKPKDDDTSMKVDEAVAKHRRRRSTGS